MGRSDRSQVAAVAGSTVGLAVTDAPGHGVSLPFDAGYDEITPQSVNGAQVAVRPSIPSVTESNVHALLNVGVDVVGYDRWTETYARA